MRFLVIYARIIGDRIDYVIWVTNDIIRFRERRDKTDATRWTTVAYISSRYVYIFYPTQSFRGRETEKCIAKMRDWWNKPDNIWMCPSNDNRVLMLRVNDNYYEWCSYSLIILIRLIRRNTIHSLTLAGRNNFIM